MTHFSATSLIIINSECAPRRSPLARPLDYNMHGASNRDRIHIHISMMGSLPHRETCAQYGPSVSANDPRRTRSGANRKVISTLRARSAAHDAPASTFPPFTYSTLIKIEYARTRHDKCTGTDKTQSISCKRRAAHGERELKRSSLVAGDSTVCTLPAAVDRLS